jgi:uncharacterized membrane protein
MTPGFVAHVRSRMGSGLLIVLPLLITIWLLGLLVDLVDSNVTPWIRLALQAWGVADLDVFPAATIVTVVGLLLAAVFVYLVGLVGGNLAGRRVVALVESGILKVPLVKGIYGSARQLLDAISMTSKRTFSKVVLVQYPRRGLWTVGFVTSEAEHHLGDPREGPLPATMPVFLPTTPNPTSGWLVFVRADDLVVLDMTIEEGLKLIVSGGIVSPDDLGTRILPPPRRPET